MIPLILREIERNGCQVSVENSRLKLVNADRIPLDLKEKIRQNKREFIDFFTLEAGARRNGWIVYPHGECFEKWIGFNSYLYIFSEDSGNYTVWRGTWREKAEPSKEKVVGSGLDLKSAFRKATDYAKWFKK